MMTLPPTSPFLTPLVQGAPVMPKSLYMGICIRADRLFGSGKFQLDLEPVPGESKRLKGIHIYKPGNKVIQKAEEDYKYLGF